MALNQTTRLIRMTAGPLGPDEVVVTSLSGREMMSHPFGFEIEFISTRLDLKPAEIIGADVSLELDRRDPTARPIAPRHFHGYVSRFAAGDVEFKPDALSKYRHYRAEVVPWLWFLAQTARCYVFFPEREEKSIFDVIEAVITRAKSDLHVDPVTDLAGIGELKSRKVKHCVQYRETDFNFLSRTLEKYGAFYYFRFEAGKHTLVLEMKKNYPPCEEAEVTYPRISGGQPLADHVTHWQHDYEFVSGKWSHTDYNYEKPSTPLVVSAPRLPAVDLPLSDRYEVYDYPGGYQIKSEGEADARIRQEAREVAHNTVNGASTCRTFTAGHKFTLTGHPDEDAATEHGKAYVLTSVQHSATQPSDDTSDGAGASYVNRFTCVPDTVQYRPDRRTPWPMIAGIQTAVVVGPPGSEIHEGKYGQVKVQFHWDREGKKDGNSSCWVRVASPWAGKGWGGVSTPRVGHEVVIEFLEGDPDRPLIIGNVYNDDNKPPHTGVVSGLKSNTHKGSGYNSMTMDDTAGKEKITIHAQYDMGTTVEHDQTNTVHNDFTETIKKNATITVTEGNLTHGVKTGTASYYVKGAVTQKFENIWDSKVTDKVSIKSNSDIIIDSDTKITLVTGGSKLVMESNGTIALTGSKITIIGKDEVGVSSTKTSVAGSAEAKFGTGNQTVATDTAKVAVSGAAISSSATGTHEITGAVVKIN
jgi:type VI secretion system secreted protein VgrG